MGEQFLTANPMVASQLAKSGYTATYAKAWSTDATSVTATLKKQGFQLRTEAPVANNDPASLRQQHIPQQQQPLQPQPQTPVAASSSAGGCCTSVKDSAAPCAGAWSDHCWSAAPATGFCGQTQTNCEEKCGSGKWCPGAASLVMLKFEENKTRGTLYDAVSRLSGTFHFGTITGVAAAAALIMGFVVAAAVRTRPRYIATSVDSCKLVDGQEIDAAEIETMPLA